jgi:hypothetical protein
MVRTRVATQGWLALLTSVADHSFSVFRQLHSDVESLTAVSCKARVAAALGKKARICLSDQVMWPMEAQT